MYQRFYNFNIYSVQIKNKITSKLTWLTKLEPFYVVNESYWKESICTIWIVLLSNGKFRANYILLCNCSIIRSCKHSFVRGSKSNRDSDTFWIENTLFVNLSLMTMAIMTKIRWLKAYDSSRNFFVNFRNLKGWYIIRGISCFKNFYFFISHN